MSKSKKEVTDLGCVFTGSMMLVIAGFIIFSIVFLGSELLSAIADLFKEVR